MASDMNGFKKVNRQTGKTLKDTFIDKGKRDRNDYKTVTFWLEKDLHAAFKSYCAKNNISMTDVLTDYINTIV